MHTQEDIYKHYIYTHEDIYIYITHYTCKFLIVTMINSFGGH